MLGGMVLPFFHGIFFYNEIFTLAKKVMDEGLTLIKDDANLLPLNSNEKVLVVFPKIKVVTLVDNEDSSLNSLGDFMSFKVDKFYTTLDPTEDEKNELLELSSKYDKIVYCSYNACFYPAQADLINSLNQDKLIVIAVRTPYDLNVLNTKTYILSYEASVLSFESLAKALTGQIKMIGKCPVTLD